jgi:methylornithine synthase
MSGPVASSDVRRMVRKALAGGHLRLAEVRVLLGVDDSDTAAVLFDGARELREACFGRRVFLYGFVYFSTFCRNRCTFCFYRRGNTESPRYRKGDDEVVEIARGLAASGVHLVDLTMGEDPDFYDVGDFAGLVDLVRRVRQEAAVPVMVSPGVVPDDVLAAFKEAGADWYACYQETHTPGLFKRLRPDQDYLAREASRSRALAAGLHAEDGILLGVGESVDDRARSLLTMRAQGAQQVRVMGFVPQKGTPFFGQRSPTLLAEMVTLATMRLLMPERLIPASLDIDGLRGLEARLRAGANVVTSIIPPALGLAGVSQSTLDIDQGFRTVAGVERHLAPLGLETASLAEYETWLRASAPSRAVGLAGSGESSS